MNDKMKAITIFSAFLFVAFGVFYFGIYRQDMKNEGLNNNESSTGTENPNVPSEEFLKTTTQKTYEELKQEAPEIVTSPNIYDAETKSKFEEIAKSQNPENYFIVFDGRKFDPDSVTIFQGDIITWRNRAVSDMTIKGQGGWGNPLPVETDQAFSQQFDYLGTYKYTSGDNENIAGEIIVLAR